MRMTVSSSSHSNIVTESFLLSCCNQTKFILDNIINSLSILSITTILVVSLSYLKFVTPTLTVTNNHNNNNNINNMPPSLKEMKLLNGECDVNSHNHHNSDNNSDDEYVYKEDSTSAKPIFRESSSTRYNNNNNHRDDNEIEEEERDITASCSSSDDSLLALDDKNKNNISTNSTVSGVVDVTKWLGSEQTLLGIEMETKGIRYMLQELTESEMEQLDDDSMLIRFLREYKGDAKKALKAMRTTIQWRKEFDVDGLLKVAAYFPDNVEEYSELHHTIVRIGSVGSAYTRGYDKDGRALHLCDALLLKPFLHEIDNVIKCAVIATEKSIACTKRKSAEISLTNTSLEKFVIAFDFTNFRVNNKLPIWFSRKLLHISQTHYPGRIHKVYLIHTPKIFEMFWNILKPFVNPTVRDVVVFCTTMDDFTKHVMDPTKLETRFGGPIDNPVRPFDIIQYKDLPLNVSFDE